MKNRNIVVTCKNLFDKENAISYANLRAVLEMYKAKNEKYKDIPEIAIVNIERITKFVRSLRNAIYEPEFQMTDEQVKEYLTKERKQRMEFKKLCKKLN